MRAEVFITEASQILTLGHSPLGDVCHDCVRVTGEDSEFFYLSLDHSDLDCGCEAM